MSGSTLHQPLPLPPALARAENLPSLPTVAVEVLRLTQDDDCTLEDLSQVLGRDPALSAKLLKLANSSYFSPGSPVTTLQRATMVLGLKTVKLMALSFSLVGVVQRQQDDSGFDLRDFWRRSIVNAVTSRLLGERLRPALGDEAFLCGLLGHMGRLVLAQALGELYAPVLREHGAWPSVADERRTLGFDSGDVAQALFQSWQIPAEVHLPLRHRNDPSRLPAEAGAPARQLSEVLAMALLAEEVLCGADSRAALERLVALAGATLGFTAEGLGEFLVRLESRVAETAALLNVELPAGLSHQDILDQARRGIVNVATGLDLELRQATRRSAELEGTNRALRTSANVDELTGLANRKGLDAFLREQVNDRLRGAVPRALGVLMIDIDRFKQLNDSYSHQAGDEVLRMVGGILARSTRRGDFPARYGGDEFALVLPQTTPFSLRAAAERLRQEIERASVAFEIERVGEAPVRVELEVTTSFGGVCCAELEHEDDGKRLLKLADHYLYKAKENGRNCSKVLERIVTLPRR